MNPEQEAQRLLIKKYRHWSLHLHNDQNYLGRAYVWCLREDARDLADSSLEEQQELFLIMKEFKQVLTVLFQPDIMNYASLGNRTYHLHVHLVPRYANSRNFAGHKFTDPLWGKHYKTHHDYRLSDEIMDKIIFEIKKQLHA
jgi:diadenosine tetraphosphate (Ap4A) HIT family hydrolase